MKLIRFGPAGFEKPGIVLENGNIKDCSGWFKDWNGSFFSDEGLSELASRSEDWPNLPDAPGKTRIGAPIARSWKVICVGLNYSDHAIESGLEPTKEPVLFTKTSNTLVGPYDDVLIPPGSKKTDWEVELGVIIGKITRRLASPDDAVSHIAGYCVSHDVSEREFQLERGGQWVKGKSCDTFNPLGPWLVTPDEAGDPGVLNLWLDVNGKRMQSGNTSFMIFDVSFLIYYISQFITLEPGDLINTGTPAGVGLGRDFFLKRGDIVTLGIDKLGSQEQRFV